MIRTPLSRLASLRCPRCGELQSTFAARSTWRGATKAGALAPSLTCNICGCVMKCRARIGLVGYWIIYPVIIILFFKLFADIVVAAPVWLAVAFLGIALAAKGLLSRAIFYMEELK